ncbi:hypothetical protein Ctha_0878 [Chloroherpeton thalassium ATCC 35110]|uniref:Uncharacterized protein n=1 Tax=Chloroherpeton thalassium (strain ATCC 35110 / GB-78) TaxID=517418 RepID=B3QWY2_CHLT3|nr:hypothetical protein [Chloroherpeton thalassium]ACF13346.1 hypothetical protein Ctha_0878 [Chloroherpeton thalassium ATCC 35110]
MKKPSLTALHIVSLLLLCLPLGALHAQETLVKKGLTVKQSNSTTPAACVFLGNAYSMAEKPATHDGVLLYTANALSNSGSLLNSFAIDIHPYWLSERKTVQAEKYFNATFSERLVRDFSFSIAASETFRNFDGISFAIAAKTNLIIGKPGQALSDELQALATPETVSTKNAKGQTAASETTPSQTRLMPIHLKKVGFSMEFAFSIFAAIPKKRF